MDANVAFSRTKPLFVEHDCPDRPDDDHHYGRAWLEIRQVGILLVRLQ